MKLDGSHNGANKLVITAKQSYGPYATNSDVRTNKQRTIIAPLQWK